MNYYQSLSLSSLTSPSSKSSPFKYKTASGSDIVRLKMFPDKENIACEDLMLDEYRYQFVTQSCFCLLI